MFKKIFLTLLVLYIIVTGAYFAMKTPAIKKYLSKKQEVVKAPEVKEQTGDCLGFAMGHIAGEDFRINTRVLSSSKLVPIDENDVRGWIAKNTCDRGEQEALIYYNSRPVAIAQVTSFDYSKPLGEKSNERPILYTVLKTKKVATVLPTSGYVIAVFDYDQKNMDFYDKIETTMSKADEELIGGSCDTIYYEIVGKDPSKTEIEYTAIKTDLDINGDKLISVLATWNDPELPRTVKYLSIFNIHQSQKASGSKRYQLFPINKVRNSSFSIFQIADVDNDGYKETIIRKERESSDAFTMYDYDPEKDTYIEKAL